MPLGPSVLLMVEVDLGDSVAVGLAHAERSSPDSAPALISAILLGTVGVLSFIVQPGIVQGFVTELGRTESEAVNLAGIEMLGVAAAAVFLAFFSGRLQWRLIVAVGLILAAAGNLLSAALISSEDLILARFLAGLGHGTIISISFTLIGATSKPERNLAWYLVLLLTYGALALWSLPAFFAAFGIDVLFYAFGAVSLLSLPMAFLVCNAHPQTSEAGARARQLGKSLILLALAGVLAYNIAIGIAWGILALVGMAAGFGEQSVADALFVSQVVAIGGALASVFLAERMSSHLAIAIGIIGGALSIALLISEPNYQIFLIAVCSFNGLWNFALPFILAKVCDFETRGRMMSYAIALQTIGVAVGPLLAGALIGDGDYTSSQVLCIAMFIVSYALLLAPMTRHREALLAEQRV